MINSITSKKKTICVSFVDTLCIGEEGARVTLNVCRALAGALRPLTLSVSMLTSWETKKPKRRDFGGNAIVSLQCQFLFDLCQCLAHKGGNPGNGTQYANFFILEYQNHKNPRPDSKSQFTPMQSFEEKTQPP